MQISRKQCQWATKNVVEMADELQHVEIPTRSGAEPPLEAVREGAIVIVGRRVACGGVVGPRLLGTHRERPTGSVGACGCGKGHEFWNERRRRAHPVEQVNSEGGRRDKASIPCLPVDIDMEKLRPQAKAAHIRTYGSGFRNRQRGTVTVEPRSKKKTVKTVQRFKNRKQPRSLAVVLLTPAAETRSIVYPLPINR